MPRIILPFALAAFLALRFVNATPPFGSTQDDPPHPISGDESEMRRLWRKTVAQATQSWQPYRGQSSSETGPTTVSSPRSGPISAVYRATLSAETSSTCVPGSKKICRVAVESFAKVGAVQYAFRDKRRNIRGNSGQVMVACRCLSKICDLAILVRPVDIMTREADGTHRFSGNRTCLYEAVEGKYSDCHSEVLRVTNQDRTAVDDKDGRFEYAVSDSYHGDFWKAVGRRGISTECLDTDIRDLPPVNISRLKSDDVRLNTRDSSASDNFCQGTENVQYFRSEDPEDGEECSRIYDNSMAVAAHAASQQDCFAVGKVPGTYLEEPSVPLLTNTELALSCSAAALGIIFLASLYHKQMKKKDSKYVALAWVVFFQVLSYSLEALPLHMALGSEVSARNWRSLFAFVDATLGLRAPDSATGGVLVIAVVLGELQHHDTRVLAVAILTAIFDLIAIILVIATVATKSASIQAQKITDKEFHFIERESTSSVVSSGEMT